MTTRVTTSLAAFAVFIGVLIMVPPLNSRSQALVLQPDGTDTPSLATAVEAISLDPKISFLDDGRPVITYADHDPAGPVFAENGERIPDPSGPQPGLLVCGDPACTGPPASNVKIPVKASEAIGAVVGDLAVVAAQTVDGPVLVSCAADTCLGSVSLINLAVGTDPDASVRDLKTGPDGQVYVLLGTTGPDPTTWLTTCLTHRCDSPQHWQLASNPSALGLNSARAPLLIGAQGTGAQATTGNLTLINCLQPACDGGVQYGTDLLGTAPVVTASSNDHPIVAYLDPTGALRIAHCDDPFCTDTEQVESVLIEPTVGRRVSTIVGVDTWATGAPLVTFTETDMLGKVSWRQVIAPQCAVPHCLGDGSSVDLALAAPGGSNVHTASSVDGTIHVAWDNPDAAIDFGWDAAVITHTSCGLACQCAITTCAQHAPADVCGAEWQTWGQAIEIAIDVGTVAVVDLALGESPTSGQDLILGTPQDDQIVADAGDFVCGGPGNDSITFNSPTADLTTGTVFGGAGDDVIDLGALGGASVWAGSGDDTVAGSAGNDELNGNSGSDRIWGRAGDDKIFGESGDDKIRGGPGDDTLNGDAGADDINGSSGDDNVVGGDGADTLRGGTGDDLLRGDAGDDLLISGNGGSDFVSGGDGNDVLIAGGPRPDILSGGDGNDVLKGHGGADTLNGDAGDDEVRGGPQPDTILGGTGVDACYGGTQIDSFAECESTTE